MFMMQPLSFSSGNVLSGSLALCGSYGLCASVDEGRAKTGISNITTPFGIVNIADNDSSRKMRYSNGYDSGNKTGQLSAA
jgi:hypothetical protein